MYYFYLYCFSHSFTKSQLHTAHEALSAENTQLYYVRGKSAYTIGKWKLDNLKYCEVMETWDKVSHIDNYLISLYILMTNITICFTFNQLFHIVW